MFTDILVIGSGQAGVPLAGRLARAGRKVMLFERGQLGGTCINTGCTPTKAMIASARAAHVARHAARLGVHADGVRVDLAAVVDRKDAIVRQWRDGVAKGLAKAGENLTLVRAHARFVGPREVEADGRRYQADTIVINVGGRPVVPKIPGLEDVPWLDNARIMELREVPRHLVVLGGGYIGCEFAQMFRRFGAEVTLLDQLDRLLGLEDPDVSKALGDVFEKEGLRLELGAGVEGVARAEGGITVVVKGGAKVEGSHLLVAVGRRPNTDDLGCDAAGVARDEKGYISVDDQYRTGVEGVYAVGDCTPGPQFTHASWDDHRLLFDVLAGKPTRKRSERLVPITAFTDPQVARVGLTEEEVKKKGIRYEVATMPFGHIARAIETDETAGTLKVLLDPQSERLLGAAVVGSGAGELIHVFVAVMQAGATARAVVDAEFVHPTFAEGLQSVVMKLERYKL